MTDTMMPSLLILIITLWAVYLYRRYRNRFTRVLLIAVIIIDVLIALPVVGYFRQR